MCLNYFQAENQPCNDKIQENDLPDEEILSMALEIEENLEVMRENINPVVPVKVLMAVTLISASRALCIFHLHKILHLTIAMSPSTACHGLSH